MKACIDISCKLRKGDFAKPPLSETVCPSLATVSALYYPEVCAAVAQDHIGEIRTEYSSKAVNYTAQCDRLLICVLDFIVLTKIFLL